MIAWLTDTFIYTGVLIAAVLLLRRPVTRHFGAQTAYMLWALPFLRLLLPPLVLPARFAPKQVALAMEQADIPPLQLTEVPGGAAVELPVSADPVVALPDLATMAVAVWLIGALALLAWRIASYQRMRREVLIDARPVGEVGRVRLLESPAVNAPVAFGVADKVVALPMFFMARPDRQGRDLAIAHELAHHRGHDLLANFAAQALLALHWFNPLAWLGWRAMRRDQEAACDARVLSGRDHADRMHYAALIASFATAPRPAQFRALAAPMACPVLGEASIIHRLRSLSMDEISTRRRRTGRALVVAGVLALPMTASISYAAADRAQTTETRTDSTVTVLDVAGDGASRASAPLFTHTVERPDGTQVTLRTDRRLSGEEAELRVEQAFAAIPPVPPVPPVPPAAPLDSEVPPVPAAPRMALSVPEAPAAPAAPALRAPRQIVMKRSATATSARSDGGEGASRRFTGFDADAFAAEMDRVGAELERSLAGVESRAAAAAAAAADRAHQVKVRHSCDSRIAARAENSRDGSQTVVICQKDIDASVLTALQSARSALLSAEMPEYARAEALREMDSEIARLRAKS